MFLRCYNVVIFKTESKHNYMVLKVSLIFKIIQWWWRSMKNLISGLHKNAHANMHTYSRALALTLVNWHLHKHTLSTLTCVLAPVKMLNSHTEAPVPPRRWCCAGRTDREKRAGKREEGVAAVAHCWGLPLEDSLRSQEAEFEILPSLPRSRPKFPFYSSFL